MEQLKSIFVVVAISCVLAVSACGNGTDVGNPKIPEVGEGDANISLSAMGQFELSLCSKVNECRPGDSAYSDCIEKLRDTNPNDFSQAFGLTEVLTISEIQEGLDNNELAFDNQTFSQCLDEFEELTCDQLSLDLDNPAELASELPALCADSFE
jgi:hypothetical protein